MSDNQDKINQLLLEKMELLFKKQDDFKNEIKALKQQIVILKSSEGGISKDYKTPKTEEPTEGLPIDVVADQVSPNTSPVEDTKPKDRSMRTAFESHQVSPKKKVPKTPKIKRDLEKFIGENLISKIGIAITIIGVAIGAKYTIENDLISPLTRIILGYLVGFGLLAFGIKLKAKYTNFSAVLVSGAIAIMYFITFAAYSFYGLFPQTMAFALMVVFTTFSVVAAINYNKQVIAHIGLVGAYAVPFLLSDGSGQVVVLLSYMAIINIGILVIAIKKYWKSLYYSAFGFTWLIYFVWYTTVYQDSRPIGTALIFLSIFFVTFYFTFLVYKLIKKEKFEALDIILLLTNAFIFYGLGFGILSEHETGSQLLGIFTLVNAVVHFVVTAVIYKQKLGDKNLFYLAVGMVLVFITIAFPVQLDGNWVTLLWVGEAALLFWIGRTKGVPIYEKLSYPVMVLAFISILQDWSIAYHNYNPDIPDSELMPLLNIHFLSSILFVGAFGFITYLNQKKDFTSAFSFNKDLLIIVNFAIPTIFLFALYNAFRLEIVLYWDQLDVASIIELNVDEKDYKNYVSNYDLFWFKTIWVAIYSLFFLTVLSFLNINKIKNQALGYVNLGLNVIAIAFFLFQGLFALSELRISYLTQELAEYYHIGVFNIVIRYVSFIFLAATLVACYQYILQDFIKPKLQLVFDLLLHITVLWVLSSELISWLDIAGVTQTYKLGLSILWGVYALFLIALGIWRSKKHLRIGAIALFGVTLVKLFFYDISQLDTIAKTIVFVSLGILLLIISFLYNKYKHIISNEN